MLNVGRVALSHKERREGTFLFDEHSMPAEDFGGCPGSNRLETSLQPQAMDVARPYLRLMKRFYASMLR